MNPSINLADWHNVLQDALYWKHLSPDEAILLFTYTNRAHADNCEYYANGPGGESVNLTKIFEQFILLDKLKANYEPRK